MPDGTPGTDWARPHTLELLRSLLAERDVAADLEVDERIGPYLCFDLEGGEFPRKVIMSEEQAKRAGSDELVKWRALGRYNGFWNKQDGIVEVGARDNLSGSGLVSELRRTPKRLVENHDTNEPRVVIGSSDGKVRVSLGKESDAFGALKRSRLKQFVLQATQTNSAGKKPLFSPDPAGTIRIDGLHAADVKQAETLAEQILDALSLELDIATGVCIAIHRRNDRDLPKRDRGAASDLPELPRHSYPHDLIMLYQAGRMQRLFPTVRFLLLYQVLEYFFPELGSQQRLDARKWPKPKFRTRERKQLRAVLGEIVTSYQVADEVVQLDLVQHLTDSESTLSNELVDVSRLDDLLDDLALRVYDIRCQIAHSKNQTGQRKGPGLMAGSVDDDQLFPELALMEFLAQRAISYAKIPIGITSSGGPDD